MTNILFLDLIQKNKIFQMQKLLLRKNFINVSDINLRLISNLTDERFHNFKGLRKDNSAISFFLLSSMNDFNEMKKYTTLLNRSIQPTSLVSSFFNLKNRKFLFTQKEGMKNKSAIILIFFLCLMCAVLKNVATI